MYAASKYHYLFFLAILQLPLPDGVAQGVLGVHPNTLKPRIVYEQQVKDPGAAQARTAGSLVRGTLTRLGRDLLINDPVNSQLIVVDVATLMETNIQLQLPAIDLKIDPETQMLFVEILNPIEPDDAISSQTCYENLEKLRSHKPQWKSGTRLPIWQQIRSLKNQQRFVIVSSVTDTPVVLLDKQGVKLIEQKINGEVLGFDEVEEGFNIFFLREDRGGKHLALTQLDNEWKVSKTQKLKLMDRLQSPGGSSLGIFQSVRLRGLKPGEVTKYFLNVASQPGYLDMRGRLPIATVRSRFYHANKLSAAESIWQPEIIVGLSSPRRHFADGFILFDQQGNFYYDPDQWLTDAIFDEERKLIVTVGHSQKPRHRTVRLISFE